MNTIENASDPFAAALHAALNERALLDVIQAYSDSILEAGGTGGYPAWPALALRAWHQGGGQHRLWRAYGVVTYDWGDGTLTKRVWLLGVLCRPPAHRAHPDRPWSAVNAPEIGPEFIRWRDLPHEEWDGPPAKLSVDYRRVPR